MIITDLIKPGMKGAFYGRHSTDKQEMDSQNSACEEFVRRHELSLVGRYLDSAVSARKKEMNERPELKRLLDDAQKRLFDFVLVWAEDRLARKTREHREIRKKFVEYKIPVYVLHNNTRYDEGELLSQTIRDSFSQYQGDKIAGDTKRAMRTLLKEGQWTGGSAPYGYRYLKDTKKFETIPDEIEHVQKIFSLYKQGNLGFRAIAGMLPKESRRGRDWKWNHIKEIITNPFYAGILTLNRRDSISHLTVNKEMTEWLQGSNTSIKPVVTLEAWKETWFIYKNRRDYYDGEESLKNAGLKFAQFYVTKNVLNGLLFCTECNERLKCKDMTSKNKNNGKDYGDIFYVCRECNYKVGAEKLSPIIDAIWKKIQRSVDVTRISEVVYVRFQNEVTTIQHRTEFYEKQIQEFSNNKVHYESWIEEYGKIKSEDRDVYEAFSLANAYNEQNLLAAKKMYARYKHKLDFLKQDRETVIQETEKLVNTIKCDRKSLPVHDEKQLLQFALAYLTIDQNGKIEYAIKSELL
ncbi:recombinase family protein [Paenibacillus sp. FSL H7-0735]|uniref:recombinase family protein n=1 Tax=Paenibacillus sp. FSL H7-0735 TaxID=2954736 RepID=UPI0030F866CF